MRDPTGSGSSASDGFTFQRMQVLPGVRNDADKPDQTDATEFKTS